MTIMLPPEQMRWLEAEVAAGRFASVEEALALAVERLRSESIVVALSDDERVSIRAALAEADAGDFASVVEVEAALAKFGP